MHREIIHSTPSWRRQYSRHDCVFIVADETKSGMRGMIVGRVKLFFSFVHNGVTYPCALVDRFSHMAAHLLPVFGDGALPVDFHFAHSLDAFNSYYVNKYADHHANEIVF
ncbi:hypothetical protein DEU56DRAFT_870395 [Suillus clintonianus]|uniref:uncharacterized protein n=1 Tax=Suillus clintonianus TaxID=1904413 RepID=UPI001B87E390|nr:uncharacterized protein DEU56DRAFT_870395 [Suillus clintonianus]KAG2144246.1 hypothetical protein DEU56DRAFT_870395 [Suillus clintonianus]